MKTPRKYTKLKKNTIKSLKEQSLKHSEEIETKRDAIIHLQNEIEIEKKELELAKAKRKHLEELIEDEKYRLEDEFRDVQHKKKRNEFENIVMCILVENKETEKSVEKSEDDDMFLGVIKIKENVVKDQQPDEGTNPNKKEVSHRKTCAWKSLIGSVLSNDAVRMKNVKS